MDKRIESLPKQFTEAKRGLSQQHQLVHGYRWAPRTLILQGKPVVQGACPPEDKSFGGGHPFVYQVLLSIFKKNRVRVLK